MGKNMGKLIVGVACLALLLVAVRMASHGLGREREFAQPKKEAASQSTPVVQQANAVEEIILGKAPDEPIGVVRMQLIREGDHAGNLLLEVENKSETSVTFVRYWLLPMPCRQYDIGNLSIVYGDERSPTKKPIDGRSILAPHQKATIEVESEKLKRYLKPKGTASMGCRPDDPEEKPHLSLWEVHFADGSVWDISKQPRATNP